MDDEIVLTDPQEFDCSQCVTMAMLAGLDADNQAAWMLYRKLCNRFVNDLQAGSVLLARLTQDLDSDEFGSQCDRLCVIYDVLQPPKTTT